MRHYSLVLFVFFSIALKFNAQALASEYSDDIQAVLEKADSNRVELEKVIEHYKSLSDTLRLEAARFLLSNMQGHAYALFALYDSAKNEVPFNAADYPNYDALVAAWDTIESNHPGLDFDKKEVIYDLKTIKADYLINQIDLAFQAWREKPWASWLNFEQFKEYVLPYRGSNEPLEEWRPYFIDKYKDLQSRMNHPSDPIEAARLINNDVKTWFTFDTRYYFHPTDQGLAEMINGHLGRCEDMTNVTIYAMRANGLAVTSDYTPYWANSGNNHAWNSILTPDGNVVPFMGAEANPGEYSLWNKLAKVYRKMYSQNKDNLVFLERKQKGIPAWLGGKSYIDVTPDYVKTADVTIKLEEPVPDSTDIAYICVFNDGGWRPIHWGRINGENVTFSEMGGDIAYLPAYFVTEDSLKPAGPPFILNKSFDMTPLKPITSSDAPGSIVIAQTMDKSPAPSTDGVDKSPLESGETYELYYWDNGWVSSGKSQVSKESLTLNLPRNRLYWLIKVDGDRDERIFTIDENGAQIWW